MPEFLKGLGLVRIGAMAAVVAALIGFFVYLTTEMVRPPMALLYSGLDPRDSASIVARLDALAVEYELKGDGTTIMVPQDRALRLRMELAGDGLPAGSSVGYEIFDQQDALGAASFLQNVNLTRALEGELARTIRSAIGYDEKRGDRLEVSNMRFAEAEIEPLAEVEEPFLGLTKSDYFRIAKIGVLGLVSVLLIFLVIRPLIRMLLAPAQPRAGVPALAAPGETALTPQLTAQSVAAQLQAPPGIAGALPAPRMDSSINIARIQGQVKESSVKKVGEIVQHHPDEAMSIMRTWIHEMS